MSRLAARFARKNAREPQSIHPTRLWGEGVSTSLLGIQRQTRCDAAEMPRAQRQAELE